jgi:hypothetical protein
MSRGCELFRNNEKPGRRQNGLCPDSLLPHGGKLIRNGFFNKAIDGDFEFFGLYCQFPMQFLRQTQIEPARIGLFQFHPFFFTPCQTVVP